MRIRQALIDTSIGSMAARGLSIEVNSPIIVAKPQAQYNVVRVPASFEDVTPARLALMPMKV